MSTTPATLTSAWTGDRELDPTLELGHYEEPPGLKERLDTKRIRARTLKAEP